MALNCSTCKNNDGQHEKLCGDCIRIGGASGLPHYEPATSVEVVLNNQRLARIMAANRDRPAHEVLAAMDAHLPPPETTGCAAYAPDAKKDMVNLPSHYARFSIEPMQFVVENAPAFKDPRVAALVAHIVPYIMRFDDKNGVEDLRKAQRVLDMLISLVKGDPDWWKAPTNG